MQQKKSLLKSVAIGVAALAVNSAVFAGTVPLENRLSEWSDDGTSAIAFTDLAITYTNGKTKKGQTTDTTFFGESSRTTQLELFNPAYGYGEGTVGTSVFGGGGAFDGVVIIDAKISSRGILRSGSTFSIYSNDAVFGTGNTTDYNCKRNGVCESGQLVYGGDLTQFGWSGSQGLLEFAIGNLSGWAHDMWAPDTTNEHIYLDVDQFSLNDVSSVKSFTATADGFAVVPVPAAAWLFGSGLLGLAGMARRKRS